MLTLGVVWLGWHLVMIPLLWLLWGGLVHLGFVILRALAPLIVLSILISVFCGEKGRTIIFNLWLGAIQVSYRLLESLIKLAIPSRKAKGKGKDK